MQVRVRSKKLFVLWSVYVAGWYFIAGVAFIVAGLLGKFDLHVALILGGLFGVAGVYQWHRLSAWHRQQARQFAPPDSSTAPR